MSTRLLSRQHLSDETFILSRDMDDGIVPIIDDVPISYYDENRRFKIESVWSLDHQFMDLPNMDYPPVDLIPSYNPQLGDEVQILSVNNSSGVIGRYVPHATLFIRQLQEDGIERYFSLCFAGDSSGHLSIISPDPAFVRYVVNGISMASVYMGLLSYKRVIVTN